MSDARDDEHDRLAAAITDLSVVLGRSPNASDLAEYLGVDREDVIEGLTWRRAQSRHSAGEPVDDIGVGPEENLEVLEYRLAESFDVKGLPLLLSVLTDQERRVVLLRLAKSLPQSKIAQHLGVTPAVVSRILTRSLAILRDSGRPERDPKA